jgi:hypothetical protein
MGSKAFEYERIAFENEKIKGQLELKANKNKFIEDIKGNYKSEMDKVYITKKKENSFIRKFFKRLFKVL